MAASPKLLAHLARLRADPGIEARRRASVAAKMRTNEARERLSTTLRARARPWLSVFELVNTHTDETARGTRHELAKQLNVSYEVVCAIIDRNGKPTRSGWRLVRCLGRVIDMLPSETDRKPGRKADDDDLLGPAKMPKPNQRMRRCLLCGCDFLSDHAGNRICGAHSPRDVAPMYRVCL